MRRLLEDLRSRGELAVVDREVDGRFELAAVCQASQRDNEKAILFNNVAGSEFPVATNLFGSRDRLCRMIGADDGLFCRRWLELMEQSPTGAASADIPVRQDITLSQLPQITYQEHDAGPYITAGIFLANHPGTSVANLSFHRTMHVDDGELRIRLGTSHDLTRYQLAAEKKSQALEAAILIGPPPAYMLAAAASLPEDESEMEVAAKLGSAAAVMRPCKHIDLEVPAETEFVIEGRILPGVKRNEGPFGEFKGIYVQAEDNHVFEVLGVSCRPDAVYHGLLCGSPEDMRLLEVSVATQIYQSLSQTLPGILDVACTSHVMATVVKIDAQYEGHANDVMKAAFEVNHDYSKICIVIDADVDINNLDDVYWAAVTRASAARDMMLNTDMPGFYRDPHNDHLGRLGIDATKPWGRQEDFARTRVPGAGGINLRDYFE